MSIGTQIKKMRKRDNMTQQDLANKIKKSVRMIQKYESDEVVPSLDILDKIAHVFNSNISYLTEEPRNYISCDETDKDKMLIQLKSKALNGINEIISYAMAINKLEGYSLTFIEEEYLLDLTIDNITSIIKILSKIPADIRVESYENHHIDD